MTRTRLIAVLGGLALAGCLASCPPGPGPQPGVTGGASSGGQASTGGGAGAAQGGAGGVAPQECTDPIDQCDRAGCHLIQLGCARQRTPNGTPFSQACHDAMLDGRYWPTACIVTAPTCAAAEACR